MKTSRPQQHGALLQDLPENLDPALLTQWSNGSDGLVSSSILPQQIAYPEVVVGDVCCLESSGSDASGYALFPSMSYGSSDFEVSVLFAETTVGTGTKIMFLCEDGVGDGIRFTREFDANRTLTAWINTRTVSVSSPVVDSNWHKYTLRRIFNSFYIYVDDVVIATGDCSGQVVDVTADTFLGSTSVATDLLNGKYSDFKASGIGQWLLQDVAGAVLHDKSYYGNDGELNDTGHIDYSTADGIESANLRDGCSLVDTAFIGNPVISVATKVCTINYFCTSGGWIDWGDGSALEAIRQSAGNTSHTYPTNVETDYEIRLAIRSNLLSHGSPEIGFRHILNLGAKMYYSWVSKIATSLTSVKIGDFNANITYNFSSILSNRTNLASVDLSAPRKVKVSKIENSFSSTAIEELDLTNIDMSECTRASSCCANIASLKRLYVKGWDISNCISFTGFLSNVTLDTDNYSDLLIEFAKTGKQASITLDAGLSKYTGQAAIEAKQSLTDRGWTISDGGLL